MRNCEFRALKKAEPSDMASAQDALEELGELNALKKARVEKRKLPSFIKVRGENERKSIRVSVPGENGNSDIKADGRDVEAESSAAVRGTLAAEMPAPTLGMGLS